MNVPTQFSHLLLAYDDSPAAQIALEYACALARNGVKLTLAHTVDEASVLASAATANAYVAVDSTPILDAYNETGKKLLQRGVDTCAERGIAAGHVFLHDPAAKAIVALAHVLDADLVILGTHGRHGIARLVRGSVAEEVLRTSALPVLVVNGHGRRPRTEVFTRALVALDDSEPARAATVLAARIASTFGTHLVLCRVVDTAELSDEAVLEGFATLALGDTMHAEARTRLEQTSGTLPPDVAVDDLVVVHGKPAHEIERAALQRNCDLIILGSHGRRGLDRLLLGSVAESVLRSSVLPVLVTPYLGGGVDGVTS